MKDKVMKDIDEMKRTLARIFLVLLGLAALGEHAAAQDPTDVDESV